MSVQLEKEIQLRSKRCYELLGDSIAAFENYLDPSKPLADPIYYRARNLLKEGKAYFDQTLQHAKKLLGPVPIYATREFENWREQVLVENRIIVKGEAVEEILSELQSDELVNLMMNPEEVRAYIEASFATQKTGKRKLANIKVRMIIDRLATILFRAQELQKKAQQKQQGMVI